MKIAIVCFNLGWQSGGPRLIFAAARELGNMGHTVSVYTPEFTGAYFKELWEGLDIRVVAPEKKGQKSEEQSKGLSGWIRRKLHEERAAKEAAERIARAIDEDTDVLNVHDTAFTVAWYYRRRNPNVRVLWTENDPPYVYLPKEHIVADMLSRAYNWKKELGSRRYFKAINRVNVLDEYNKEWCRRRGLDATIVRLGVDPRFSLPVKDFTQRAGMKKVTLFALGSLNKYRHYEDTLMAVALLRKKGIDARARIIANDQWNDAVYRKVLLELIEREKITDAVDMRFTGVSEEGLREAYRETDIFVYTMYIPPPRDGFGFSIGVFEAMAAGHPVILCRTTTSTEVLEDGVNALFVDPTDPEGIAGKVEYLIKDPGKYRAIAEAGQKLVKEELTWKQYADGVVRIIADMETNEAG